MNDKQIVKLEEANNKLIRCSELMNSIGKNNQEAEQIQARLNVVNAIKEEERTRDDIQFLAQAPEKIHYRRKIANKAFDILMEELGE